MYVIGCAYGISDVLGLLWSEIESLASITLHVCEIPSFILLILLGLNWFLAWRMLKLLFMHVGTNLIIVLM